MSEELRPATPAEIEKRLKNTMMQLEEANSKINDLEQTNIALQATIVRMTMIQVGTLQPIPPEKKEE